MKAKFEELIAGFMTHKIGISDLFLNAQLATLLQAHIHKLNLAGQLKDAGIGNDSTQQHNKKIRSDKIYWLDKKNKQEDELQFMDLIEQFIDYLNRTCYTGINAYEFHYAHYDAGAAYHKHIDQFKNNSNRKYTCIAYLNDDWVEADGGQLWIHQNDLIQKILPTNRKAVFFESHLLPHEVTTTHRPRLSITGWLKRV
jgi:SM-20-related protein